MRPLADGRDGFALIREDSRAGRRRLWDCGDSFTAFAALLDSAGPRLVPKAVKESQQSKSLRRYRRIREDAVDSQASVVDVGHREIQRPVQKRRAGAFLIHGAGADDRIRNGE